MKSKDPNQDDEHQVLSLMLPPSYVNFYSKADSLARALLHFDWKNTEKVGHEWASKYLKGLLNMEFVDIKEYDYRLLKYRIDNNYDMTLDVTFPEIRSWLKTPNNIHYRAIVYYLHERMGI